MEASELKEILAEHKLWIHGKGGKRANLTGANLTGAILTGANLTGANLTGANLSGASLWDANLRDANLTGADMEEANLTHANLTHANLTHANLTHANLTHANLQNTILNCSIGLPDVSWIIPGCLVQLNNIRIFGFYLEKEDKYENFVQDSFGFFIQNNVAEETFNMLAGDRIIRNIPHWVKLSGMKQVL